MGAGGAAVQNLALKAAEHPLAAVRELGFDHWQLMGEEQRRPLLRAGLEDRSAKVRRSCALALAAGCAQAIDRPMLESVLAAETDPATREHLTRAIEGLQPGDQRL